MNKKVLIIGTGLGGLTTALRLAKRGFQVEMLEKVDRPGGRLNQLKKDGFTFDMAPSFFSMSYEFDEFAQDCGIELPFEFVPLDPLYTVNFANSDKRYVIYRDLKKLAEEFKDIEPDFERKMTAYLDSAGKFFHDSVDLVIKRNFDSKLDYLLTLAKVPWGHAPKMVRNVWQELERYFDSEEVKQIFSLVAFFLGATPFDTPALYSLLSYTEMVHDGYHNVKGGMYKIVEGLVDELEKENVKIHYNTEIVDFRDNGKGLKTLIDQNGKQWQADDFIINGDAASFRGEVFKRKKYSKKKLDKQKWTLAPFTMYLGVKGKIENIDHHNYFLGTNFKDYANKIFKNDVSLEKPYYYVNAISKFNDNAAPEGHENLFVLVPVPDLRNKPDWTDTEELANNVIKDLSERVGYDIKNNLVSKTVLNPEQWAGFLNLYQGSGLGLAHDLNQIGAFRPSNKDEKFRNVFYVGSSTVPGTGLPMAVISSKLVTERITKKYGTV